MPRSPTSAQITHRYRVTLPHAVERALHHAAIQRSTTIPLVIAAAVEQFVEAEGWLARERVMAVAGAQEPASGTHTTTAVEPSRQAFDGDGVAGEEAQTVPVATVVGEARDRMVTSDQALAEIGLDASTTAAALSGPEAP